MKRAYLEAALAAYSGVPDDEATQPLTFTLTVAQWRSILAPPEGAALSLLREVVKDRHEANWSLGTGLVARIKAELERCSHEWVSARNEVVASGEICIKCYAVRAEQPNAAPCEQPKEKP